MPKPGRALYESERHYAHRTGDKSYLCFECETPLIGPLCPACNPPGVPYRRAALCVILAFAGGLIFGAGAVAQHIF